MILERVLLHSAQRFDLELFNQMLSGCRTDENYKVNTFYSGSNYILKGFSVSGIGLKAATIDVTDASTG